MPKNCSVPNCTTDPSDRTSFYKFPLHDPERLDLWLRNMGRYNWTPSRHQYICHQHFTPSNFKVCSGVRCLKNTAVPTLFQKEKLVREHETRSKRCYTRKSKSKSIKRLVNSPDKEAVGVEAENSLQMELCNLGQILELRNQDSSQSDMDPSLLNDQQMTILHTIEKYNLAGDSTQMLLITEDQDVNDSSTFGQTVVQELDMEDSSCTFAGLSVCEVNQTPDIAYFEVIPNLFNSQTPQLTFVPETILSTALSREPIPSTVPITSKNVQGSKGDECSDMEEDKEDDINQDNGHFEYLQQEEHCYHKNSASREQLETIVEDLKQKVKTLQQRHSRHLDKLEELQKTVTQLRQSNLLYEERLQLLERANIQANAAVSDHGQIVTIIFEEENPDFFSTNIL